MRRTLVFLKKEFLEMLPPTIFFLFVFTVVLVARHYTVEDYTLSADSWRLVFISALIAGKAILIADALPLFRWLEHSRLIYNVIWRVLLYLAIVLFFQVLEDLIPLWRKLGSLSGATTAWVDEVNWQKFWATHLVFVVFLSFYSLVTGIIDALGRERFMRMLFGRDVRSGAD